MADRDHRGRHPAGSRAGSSSIAAAEQRAILVLGHGAGGGVTAADLELLARRLPPLGVTVVRFEQPWRTAGRRVAGPPPRLDEAWLAAVGWLARASRGARTGCSSVAGAPAPGWPAGPQSQLGGRRRRLPGLPAAPARPAGEVPRARAADRRRAAAGAAGHQGHLRHARTRSARRSGAAPAIRAGRAARGRPRLPAGQGRALHRRPTCATVVAWSARWSTRSSSRGNTDRG